MTVFNKLAVFWVVMELSNDFTVRAPKQRYNDKNSKTG